MKVKKGIMSQDVLADIWGEFIYFVLIKRKGQNLTHESIQFWKGNKVP